MLGSQLLKACKMRGITLAKACEMAGIKYSTLHSQISNRRPIPFESVDCFCAALDLPLRLFSLSASSLKVESSENRFASHQLSYLKLSEIVGLSNAFGTDDILDWLMKYDNHLVNHEWLIDRVDLFYPLKQGDIKIRPYRIGPQSLASSFFQLFEFQDYDDIVGQFDQATLQKIIQSHIAAASQKYVISEQTIDQMVRGTRVKGAYRRLMAPVTDSKGDHYTLVYSKLTQFS